ncbi:MAG: histidine kinase [Kocuria sp.]|nr:histidine kinase [Kocuria sp.]
MVLRLIGGLLFGGLATIDVLRALGPAHFEPRGPNSEGLEILALTGASYLPLIAILVGPRLGALALACAYVTALLSESFFILLLPGFICTVVLSMWLPWTLGALLVVAQLLATLGIGIVITDNNALLWGFILVLLIGTATALGMTIRFFRCRALLSARKIVRMESEARQVRAAERQDLARELHDLVAHDVTATALRANAGLLSNDQDFQRTALQDIADSASGTIADLRRLVNILREEPVRTPTTTVPQNEYPHGALIFEKLPPPTPTMSDVLQHSVRTLRDSGYRDIAVNEGPGWEYVTTSVRSVCQRVVQESCANIVRHGHLGGAIRIRVEITSSLDGAGHAEVEVSNQMDHSPQRDSIAPQAVLSAGGFGLLGLQERISVFGGELSSGPDGDRWVVYARLPLQEIDLRA